MSKHTPGPWRAALYLGGAYYVTDAPLHEPRGREIAQVFGSLHGPAGIVMARENAEFIASAPDMARALAAIDEALGLPADGCNSTAQTLHEIRCLKMDAAIGRLIRRRLVSGNGIPTSRAYVTAQEVHDIGAGAEK